MGRVRFDRMEASLLGTERPVVIYRLGFQHADEEKEKEGSKSSKRTTKASGSLPPTVENPHYLLPLYLSAAEGVFAMEGLSFHQAISAIGRFSINRLAVHLLKEEKKRLAEAFHDAIRRRFPKRSKQIRIQLHLGLSGPGNGIELLRSQKRGYQSEKPARETTWFTVFKTEGLAKEEGSETGGLLEQLIPGFINAERLRVPIENTVRSSVWAPRRPKKDSGAESIVVNAIYVGQTGWQHEMAALVKQLADMTQMIRHEKIETVGQLVSGADAERIANAILACGQSIWKGALENLSEVGKVGFYVPLRIQWPKESGTLEITPSDDPFAGRALAVTVFKYEQRTTTVKETIQLSLRVIDLPDMNL